MKNRKLPVIAMLFILSVANFTRMKIAHEIRVIDFIYIFAMGIFAGFLILILVDKLKNNQ